MTFYGSGIQPTDDIDEESMLINKINSLKESQRRNILSHLKFQSYIESKQNQIDQIYSSKGSSPKAIKKIQIRPPEKPRKIIKV